MRFGATDKSSLSATEYALGLHCGVTFAGIKPSSLLVLKRDEFESVGFYAECFGKKGFRFEKLRDLEGGVLVLVFHSGKMEELLFDKENKSFLEERGYFYQNVEGALEDLKAKITSGKFPHEIGIFLGYPLTDVKGFIESPFEGVKMTGYWKVYEDAKNKAKLFERFKKCSDCICKKLLQGEKLAEIFNLS